MQTITSSNNSFIKDIKKLDRKRNRWKENKFIIEGIKLIEEAILEGVRLYSIIFSESFSNLDEFDEIVSKLDKNIEKYIVTDSIFNEITDTETPQGVLGVIGFNSISLDEITNIEKPVLLFLDGLQDPGNLGTIIRTADAFNIDGIILGEGTVDPYNPKVVRATMGSIFRTKMYSSKNNDECIEHFRTKNIKIISTDLNGDLLDSKDIIGGSIFVIGNESKGVSEKILGVSDRNIRIPMPGNAESLNAGVAASIIMYEAMKSRL